jgi:MFS transporter, putative metabolite:H+ symporter
MTKQTIGTIAARMDRLPASVWHKKIIAILGLGVLCDTLDIYAGSSILAVLIADGWSNNAMNGWFISATSGGMLIGALLAGIIGDKFGRRKAFLANFLIFGIASILAALVTDMTQLIILRGIMGIGLGAQQAAATGALPEFFQPQYRGRYSGIVGFIGNVAPPIAMLFSLLIIPFFGWRVLFAGIGIYALIVWIAILKFMPESPRWCASQGLIETADKIVTEIEQCVEKEKHIILKPIEHEVIEEKPHKVPYAIIFSRKLIRRTITLSAALVGMNVAIYTIVNWIPTIFVSEGISITKSFAMSVVIMIGAPVGAFLVPLLSDRLPRRKTLSILAFGIGVLGYIYSLQRSDIMIMSIGFVMIVILYFYSVNTMFVYSGEIFPTESRLRGVGFCSGFGRFVSIFTPPIIAWILTQFGARTVFLFIFAIMTIIALIIAVFGVETRNKSLEAINDD